VGERDDGAEVGVGLGGESGDVSGNGDDGQDLSSRNVVFALYVMHCAWM
jgi:hypothetical protein